MAIDVAALKKLREDTGAGFMACKAALEKAGGEYEAALEELKRQGLARAERKAGRVASQGSVGSYLHHDGRGGVLLELNCETDFVARNEEFQQLLRELCAQVFAMSPRAVCREDLPPEEIKKQQEKYLEETKGKPEEIAKKIVEGKLKKFYFSQVCLMDQPFIKDDSVTVAELIAAASAKLGEKLAVRRFVRFRVGDQS